MRQEPGPPPRRYPLTPPQGRTPAARVSALVLPHTLARWGVLGATAAQAVTQGLRLETLRCPCTALQPPPLCTTHTCTSVTAAAGKGPPGGRTARPPRRAAPSRRARPCSCRPATSCAARCPGSHRGWPRAPAGCREPPPALQCTGAQVIMSSCRWDRKETLTQRCTDTELNTAMKGAHAARCCPHAASQSPPSASSQPS